MVVVKYTVRNFLKKMIVLSIILVLLVFSSCSKHTSNNFPDLPVSYDTFESKDIIYSDNYERNEEKTSYTVALPYQNETVDYLFKYYYCKVNNLFKKEDSNKISGNDIDFKNLDTIELPYTVKNIEIDGQGDYLALLQEKVNNQDNVSAMNNTVDLFISKDLQSEINNCTVIDINKYLSTSQFITPKYVNNDYLDKCKSNNGLYGLPCYFSAKILYGNKKLNENTIFKDYTNNNSSNQENNFSEMLWGDIDEFLSYLEKIKNDDNICSLYSSDMSVIPYITLDFSLSNDSDDINKDINDKLIEMIKNNIIVAKENEGLIELNATKLWIGGTDEFSKWKDKLDENFFCTNIPSVEDDKMVIDLYPVCVSKDCKNPQLMSDFAAFISYDVDAKLLINRLENRTGYYPLIESELLWEKLSSDDTVGELASYVEKKLKSTIVSCRTIDGFKYGKVLSRYESMIE